MMSEPDDHRWSHLQVILAETKMKDDTIRHLKEENARLLSRNRRLRSFIDALIFKGDSLKNSMMPGLNPWTKEKIEDWEKATKHIPED